MKVIKYYKRDDLNCQMLPYDDAVPVSEGGIPVEVDIRCDSTDPVSITPPLTTLDPVMKGLAEAKANHRAYNKEFKKKPTTTFLGEGLLTLPTEFFIDLNSRQYHSEYSIEEDKMLVQIRFKARCPKCGELNMFVSKLVDDYPMGRLSQGQPDPMWWPMSTLDYMEKVVCNAKCDNCIDHDDLTVMAFK